MNPENPYHLEINSDVFRSICLALNQSRRDEAATWSVDMMSGGFKFSDEAPIKLDEEHLLPCITLVRYLFAYRISLVRGIPRSDLAQWWETTKNLAPNWVGFSPDRCSTDLRSILPEVDFRRHQFQEECDRLDEEITRKQRAAEGR